MKNVQELNFCSTNDQIMSMSNKPKKPLYLQQEINLLQLP